MATFGASNASLILHHLHHRHVIFTTMGLVTSSRLVNQTTS